MLQKRSLWAETLSRSTLSTSLFLISAAPVLGASILGSAQNYAVLGGSTVTNTGPTTIEGNLGLSPGSSITGLASITLIGASATHIGDGAADTAAADISTAYTTLAGLAITGNAGLDIASELGGHTYTPGVYHLASIAQITGTLTLDAANAANAQFVFEIPSTLTTESASVVQIINGGANNSVYWRVGSSATLGTSTTFAGNILALASITLNTNATILCGRALAQTGAVTMDTNIVSSDCSAYNAASSRSDYGSLGFSGGQAPEPGTAWLFGGTCLLGAAFWLVRRLRDQATPAV